MESWLGGQNLAPGWTEKASASAARNCAFLRARVITGSLQHATPEWPAPSRLLSGIVGVCCDAWEVRAPRHSLFPCSPLSRMPAKSKRAKQLSRAREVRATSASSAAPLSAAVEDGEESVHHGFPDSIARATGS
jgi:hypothetical protein